MEIQQRHTRTHTHTHTWSCSFVQTYSVKTKREEWSSYLLVATSLQQLSGKHKSKTRALQVNNVIVSKFSLVLIIKNTVQ